MRDFKHDRQIHEIGDFIDQVSQLHTESSSVWFRGQPDGVPELMPTVLRGWFKDRIAAKTGTPADQLHSAVSTAELHLNRAFRRRGASLLPHDASLVDIYFLAQHHGMPTRLLDWSTNPLAALFFAVMSDSEADGVVLATVPDWRLTADERVAAACQHAETPFEVRSDLVVKTVSKLFGEFDPDLPGAVIPVLPDLRAGRMMQQGSCFTLHAPGSQPTPNSAVVQFTIAREEKPVLEAGLRSLGVTWATLFPDLDHLARDIRWQWGLWPPRLVSSQPADGCQRSVPAAEERG